MKELTFHRWYLPWVERWPDRPGYADVGGGSSTYAEHTERVFRLASGLRSELGVRPTDHVAVLSLNSRRYMEAYHAAFLGGCVLNPLNLRLAPKELEFIIKDSGTKTILTDAAFAPLVDAIRAQAGIETVVLMGDPRDDTAYDVAYDELVAAGVAEEPTEPAEDDVCLLMYTGGTTGLPKGVMCTQRAEALNAMHIRIAVPKPEGLPQLQHLPMFHAASISALSRRTRSPPLSTSFPSSIPSQCRRRWRRTTWGRSSWFPPWSR